ncbi:MAG: ABC transporter ATP-binding protein [Chloroflexota bacterium]
MTLLGPSGRGKSTTPAHRRLDKPDGGRIFLATITAEPPNERRMAMVFQELRPVPAHDDVRQHRVRPATWHRPAAEAGGARPRQAKVLDIGHLLDRKPGQMSGGQQQRVALGRALVKEPALFLLDEPFSNLDAALRARMRTEVKHLHLRLGTTSVFVTHDQEEAMTLSDVIAVMRDGRIVQSGPQAEVYGRPQHLYVATFVGKPRMGLIDGTLEADGSDVALAAPDARIVLGAPAALGLGQGDAPREVTLGVRAEDLAIDLSGAAGPRTFEATVRLLEPIGSDTYVELAVGGTSLVSRAAPDIPVTLGQAVRARMTGRIHLFDRATGDRIGA